MSIKGHIDLSESLLVKAEGTRKSIFGLEEAKPLTKKEVNEMHEKLDKFINDPNDKNRHCCPFVVSAIKKYRLIIKWWLEKQKRSSPTPA